MKESMLSCIEALKCNNRTLDLNLHYNKIEYVAISEGNEVTTSSYPNILNGAKWGIVFLHYKYLVQTQFDFSFFAIFMNSNGEGNDYLQENGWRFTFDSPTFSFYCTHHRKCIISKENLKIELSVSNFKMHMAELIKLLWVYFILAQKCTTQLELDFLSDQFRSNRNVQELQAKNFKLEYENMKLHEIIKSHNGLLAKITELVNK